MIGVEASRRERKRRRRRAVQEKEQQREWGSVAEDLQRFVGPSHSGDREPVPEARAGSHQLPPGLISPGGGSQERQSLTG